MTKKPLALLALAAALAISPAAKADSFNFSYTAPGGVSGSGTLAGTDLGSGTWLITSATGTFDDGVNSGPISLIPNPVAPGAATSPSTYFTFDDLLFPFAGPDQALDFDGLLFNFDSLELNLWDGGFPYVQGWAENNGNSGAGTFAITAINISPSATPEPGSLLLLGTGLAALLTRRAKVSGRS